MDKERILGLLFAIIGGLAIGHGIAQNSATILGIGVLFFMGVVLIMLFRMLKLVGEMTSLMTDMIQVIREQEDKKK